jgi:hypothetical protein
MKIKYGTLFFITIYCLCSCISINENNRINLNRLTYRYLALMENNHQFEVYNIGSSTYSNQNYQIEVIKYRPKKDIKYNVLNVGGVHGNEPGGIESINKLIEYCSATLPENIAIDFIVCMNPWDMHRIKEKTSKISI